MALAPLTHKKTAHKPQSSQQKQQKPVAGRGTTPSGVAPGSLMLGSQSDTLETNAEAMATAASRQDRSHEHSLLRPAAKASGQPIAASLEAQINWQRQSGHPLDPDRRALAEVQFGEDLGPVRIQDGPEANRLTSQLGTSAFTVGQDVFLDVNRRNLNNPRNLSILNHEIAHTIQNRHNSDNTVIRRAPPTDKPDSDSKERGKKENIFPPPYQYHSFSRLFYFLRDDMTPRHRDYLEIAKALIDNLDTEEEATRYGMELYTTLVDNGVLDLAQDTLDTIRPLLVSNAHTLVEFPPGAGFNRLYSPLTLPLSMLESLRARARYKNPKEEQFIFASLQMAMDLLVLHLTAANADYQLANDRINYYQSAQAITSSLRDVYDFYPSLMREAHAAGKDADADYYYDAGNRLLAQVEKSGIFAEVHDEYGKFWDMHRNSKKTLRVATISMEHDGDESKSGRKDYTFHGTNDVSERANALTVEQHSIDEWDFPESIDVVTRDIADQTAFMSDIDHNPEIRAAFTNSTPNMDAIADRVKVWQVLYGQFEKSEPGRGLELLFRTMTRYLQAFTAHSEFSIRDAGTSYYQSTMPKDIAGRFRQDCGVYSLIVAEEMRQVGAKANLDLEFEMYFFPGHVALVIRQRGADVFFVVNNDQIHGPLPGKKPPKNADMDKDQKNPFYESLAKSYGEVMGFGDLVAPVVGTNLGSTKDSERTFRKRAWHRYRQISAGWGLSPGPFVDKFGHLPEHEQGIRAHQEYKDAMKAFANGAGLLRNAMRHYHALLNKDDLTIADRVEVLRTTALPDLQRTGDEILRLTEIFGRYGFGTMSDGYTVVKNKQTRAMIDIDIGYIHTSPSGDDHPLFRFGWLVQVMLVNGVAVGTEQFMPAFNILTHVRSPYKDAITNPTVGQLKTAPFF